MLSALGEYEIEGLTTLIPFHQAIMATQQWARGRETCRDLIEDREWLKTLAVEKAAPIDDDAPGEGRADLHRRGVGQALRRQGDRRPSGLRRWAGAANGTAAARKPARCAARGGRRRRRRRRRAGLPHAGQHLQDPRRAGQTVQEGALITIIEAMKMENEITAHKTGVIAELPITVGDAVTSGATLAVIT